MSKLFEDFLVESRNANSVNSLFMLCSDMLTNLGFDQLLYAVFRENKRTAEDVDVGLVNHDILKGWVEHYRKNDYLEVDKTTHLLRTSPGIYNWETIRERCDLSPLQKRIMNDATDANMHHGNSISYHGPQSVRGVMLASTSEVSESPSQCQLDTLLAVSNHFSNCFVSIVLPETNSYLVTLSIKELEVLKWLATGMTRYEIADKMNVSAHTVDYHSRNIMRKLDVKNMTAALGMSIKQGLLEL